jgi:hypothetical protein
VRSIAPVLLKIESRLALAGNRTGVEVDDEMVGMEEAVRVDVEMDGVIGAVEIDGGSGVMVMTVGSVAVSVLVVELQATIRKTRIMIKGMDNDFLRPI